MSNDFLAFGAPTNGNPSMFFGLDVDAGSADDGPYKAEMMGRMESIKRGDRVVPPWRPLPATAHGLRQRITPPAWWLPGRRSMPSAAGETLHPDEPSGTCRHPSQSTTHGLRTTRFEFLQKRDAGNGIHPADHCAATSASNPDMPTAAELAEVAKASTAALEVYRDRSSRTTTTRATTMRTSTTTSPYRSRAPTWRPR